MENDKNLFPTDSLPDYLNQVIGHFKEVFEYDINAQALSSVVNCASLIDSRTLKARFKDLSSGLVSFKKQERQNLIFWLRIQNF